jgi:aminoglycoside phosphotransferase
MSRERAAGSPPDIELTTEQARRLLGRVGHVAVVSVNAAATTNHVFRVVTRDHGVFYVKFHTARWYADLEDTGVVVEREAAACDLLQKRGLRLPYVAWGNLTRTVTPRSVFISGELPGIPVPAAISSRPECAESVVRALGSYMRRLHAIEFESPGILCPEQVRLAGPTGPVPHVERWSAHPLHSAESFQRDALSQLEAQVQRGLLLAESVGPLEDLFGRAGELLAPSYTRPRLVVGNCHAWHFHVGCHASVWSVLGFYDFEAMSAGDPHLDLVEIDITLTPAAPGFAWQEPFFEAYGHRPGFEGYKTRLLYYLLFELGKSHSLIVPDQAWLRNRWMALIHAEDWSKLRWHPNQHAG